MPDTKMARSRFGQAVTEAANRAEATALLIRSGYRVYRPEADIEGEDLVLRRPGGELCAVQLKSRAYVDAKRYGARNLWMLFPDQKFSIGVQRPWFLIPHDVLFGFVKVQRGPAWGAFWHYPSLPSTLRTSIAPYQVAPPSAPDNVGA